jgi:hypothetical protein
MANDDIAISLSARLKDEAEIRKILSRKTTQSPDNKKGPFGPFLMR